MPRSNSKNFSDRGENQFADDLRKSDDANSGVCIDFFKFGVGALGGPGSTPSLAVHR